MHRRHLATLLVMAGLLIAARASIATAQPCGPGTYTYRFTNHCGETIFVGQNGPGTSSTPPQSGNWALAPSCTTDAQCGVGQTCTAAGGAHGQCTCATDADCPGSAPCVNQLCSTIATFCMPQAWSSGTFWPRTGCVLSGGSLTCATGQCGGSPRTLAGGRLDCGAGSGQAGPTPPITLFEPTTTSTAANYDVSLNNGYNVEMKVTPVGGTGSSCTFAGCTADLNTSGLATSCPSGLVFPDPRGSGAAVGCYQPQDACLSSGAGPVVSPPSSLSCTSSITTDASGKTPDGTTDCRANPGGLVTFLDMYEAKNTADTVTNTQATGNGGTPTAFSVADCPPGSEFTTAFVSSGPCATDADCTITGQRCTSGQCTVTPPPGVGVCVQFVNGVLVPAWGCTEHNLGTACGQYAGSYSDALGYTCQAVQYSGGTTYPCVPPTISGLGTCNTEVAGEGFYPGVGGLFNAAWVQAGIRAGGGATPYYETLKKACPAAYAWQYDDVSGGRSCTFGGQSSEGFAIEFCPSGAATSPPPTLAASLLPGARSVQVGSVASAFATVLNTGASMGVACGIAPVTPVAGAAFSYQTTDPSTNAPTGTPNTPADIPASGSRTFVIAFTPSAPLAPADIALSFSCSNAPAAPVVTGVNTLGLSASSDPVPDVVALAATLNGDGIVTISGVNGTGVFSVATANVGAGGQIAVSTDTGGVQLPVSVSLCQTDPGTGQCTSAIGATVTAQIDAGATPTFGVFVTATGPVAFDPAAARVFVRFAQHGVQRGSTSVAARTQ